MHRDYLLSFVTDKTGEYVAIHLDLAGVEMLLSELEGIRSALRDNDCPHTHLFGYGGSNDELTPVKLKDSTGEDNIVGQVKIYGWNEEWARRHGLKP